MRKAYHILQIDPKWRITLPKEVRRYMGLRKGSHLLVYPLNNVLLMMEVNKNFYEATKRLRKAKKNIKQSQINDLIQEVRYGKKAKNKKRKE